MTKSLFSRHHRTQSMPLFQKTNFFIYQSSHDQIMQSQTCILVSAPCAERFKKRKSK